MAFSASRDELSVLRLLRDGRQEKLAPTVSVAGCYVRPRPPASPSRRRSARPPRLGCCTYRFRISCCSLIRNGARLATSAPGPCHICPGTLPHLHAAHRDLAHIGARTLGHLHLLGAASPCRRYSRHRSRASAAACWSCAIRRIPTSRAQSPPSSGGRSSARKTARSCAMRARARAQARASRRRQHCRRLESSSGHRSIR